METLYIRADGLCIGFLGQWAEREQENIHDFFRTTLYIPIFVDT